MDVKERPVRLHVVHDLDRFHFARQSVIVDDDVISDLDLASRDGMVGLTGLEPVTPRLSSACSNQLSYRPFLNLTIEVIRSLIWRWWRHRDSNPGHPACKAGALPTELYPLTR